MMKQMLKIMLLLAVVFGAHGAPNKAHAATIQLPQTGQTGCWDAAGAVILCAGTGQDGDKLSGVASPSPRFTDNGNGTVTDNLTTLIWLKDANCFGYQDWPTALTSSNTLASGSCGLTDSSLAGDWRLPNRKELQSLIDRQNVNPALPTVHPFSNVLADWYWSSSSYVDNTLGAWNVNVHDGNVNYVNKGSYFYVWPVRGGQSGTLGSLTTSPTSKDYGSVVTNTTSAAQTFTLSNSGTGNLVVSAITLTGADSGMFTLNVGDGTAGTCGATPTIAATDSCTVSATFTPTSAGSKTASLRVGTNDLPTANTYSTLTGTGVFSIGTSVVGGNGTITCDSPVTSGSTSNCTVSANAGYHLATFSDNTVDKLASVVANAYSITNVTADHTVAGTFAIDTHTVTFTTNGGNAVSSQTVNYNTTATSPSAPTKTGYTFGGWYSDVALATAFAFSTAITADITLYAKWTINSYSVSFNSNGGSAVASQSVNYNTTATSPTAPTQTGYTFGGWYTDVALASPFAFATPITTDTTLYAKWTINSYSVTFNANGGSAVGSQTVNYNATATSPTAPTKTGYTFGGWYTDVALTTAFAFATPITADTTLYAKWTINSYSVTPTAGFGSSISPATAQTVTNAATTSFTVLATAGYGILSVTGCNGTLNGTTFTTGTITGNCTVSATAIKHNANSGSGADPTISDALKSLQAYSGQISLTTEELIRYDVAPLGANGIPLGNGVVDIADVILTLRRAVGIGSW